MSLFPAYQDKHCESTNSPNTHGAGDDNGDDGASTSWLKNSSYKINNVSAIKRIIISSSDSSDCEVVDTVDLTKKVYPLISLDSDVEVTTTENKNTLQSTKKHKKKKHKSDKHKKQKIKQEYGVEGIFFEDTGDKGNLKVDTLCSRARPLYDLSEKTLGFIKYKSHKNKESMKRYYFHNKKHIKIKKHKMLIKKTKTDTTNDDDNNTEEFDYFLNDKASKDEEKKLKIKEFNEKLSNEPNNINLWLEYINYNDDDNDTNNTIDDNTKIEKKNTEKMLNYQRKLSITEKALEKNKTSIELLKLKLYLMSELIPSDQYSEQLEKLLKNDYGNIIIWQALISSRRSSLSICTVEKIIKLYSNCFETKHKWLRVTQENYDDRLLEMLYNLLIFLRHTGCWEKMWEIIRLNLSLNINYKNTQYLKYLFDEKKLIDMEEIILASKLPLNQLWLRVELLRENCHWISVTKDKIDLIGDSNRFVSTEEIAEFINPLLSKNSNIRMAILSLLSLKIPLLPTRHCAIKDLKFEESYWCIDSVESILPMIYPCVGEISGHEKRCLMGKKLLESGITSGPQYLCYHPAQEFYIAFIRDVFFSIADNLSMNDKINIYIWWLRFERMLIVIQKNNNQNSDKGFKKLKSIIKDFLKKEDNRNNLYYYKEYALIEKEMGKFDNCLSILETAIKIKDNILNNLTIFDDKIAVLNLYRSLVETLLDARHWNDDTTSKILQVFSQMSSGQSEEESLDLTELFFNKCYVEFINDSPTLSQNSMTIFYTNFYCDAVTCYCYFLYIKNNDIKKISEIFERCLEKTNDNPQLQEIFYESQVSLFQFICQRKELKICFLEKYLNEALNKYPDNFYLLSVFASIESEMPNWNIGIKNGHNNRVYSTLALCLAGRARLESPVCVDDPIAKTAALNKLLHFYKRQMRIVEIRRCPLIWRLYMLLLREHDLCEKKGEEIYHESVASCPWARCIYIDAASIAPQNLTQIQDVIREKDLRMHVTPEELDILRE
ncbi:hypothetical protein HCN44_010393 [Aphidius gifuensis]|uniref:Protein NRDE2 homolog n=1 Tax=Aphidius gifuensis TaxID=684658 RepID=A0A834XX82_APHGI|nr:nuclear exosome regulator NRDE2 [Aphidius gifuensis]KAF7993786.1 hypothetical protein HCN44_010393 [Aphidius gifuensis]